MKYTQADRIIELLESIDKKLDKKLNKKLNKKPKCETCQDTGLYTITGDNCYAGQVHACPGGCKASRKYL